MISNEKNVNCKDVDLVEYYNFDVDIIFVTDSKPSHIRSENLY